MKAFNIDNYSKDDFSATYSPEDNKLRLYADVRLDREDWLAMKAAGWRWAPKQELFFAMWSVSNEDFCLALAGDIMPEEMTMAERAELKADRLVRLAEKRAAQSFGYQAAAHRIAQRFEAGQPILIGHHSQRKAERDKTAMERNMTKAVETSEAVGYWVWRAKGVLCHADHKNSPRTIANRIKTLLADLRTAQRSINDAARLLQLCEKGEGIQDAEKRHSFVVTLAGSSYCNYEFYKKVESGEVKTDEALEQIKASCNKTINSQRKARYLNHLLNRLAYEQSNLATVFQFDGELTPGILQTFLRAHGTDKPKVTKGDGDSWIAESTVPLPLHLGDGCTLELSDSEWRELMQSVGYEVPAKKGLPPILNFESAKPFEVKRLYNSGLEQFAQLSMTKAEYAEIHPDRRRTRLSACGQFRFKAVLINKDGCKGYWDTTEYAVFLSDSKTHPLPDSHSLQELAEAL